VQSRNEIGTSGSDARSGRQVDRVRICLAEGIASVRAEYQRYFKDFLCLQAKAMSGFAHDRLTQPTCFRNTEKGRFGSMVLKKGS
jgi:hypothetical protein